MFKIVFKKFINGTKGKYIKHVKSKCTPFQDSQSQAVIEVQIESVQET